MRIEKKGISQMIGYVILISIAIVISVILYAFLKLFLPEELPQCKEGINIVVENVENCNGDSITLTLKNTGRFKINGAYVRISDVGKKNRFWLNDPAKQGVTHENFLFRSGNKIGLLPGEKKKLTLAQEEDFVKETKEYELEVQPFIFTKKENIEELTLCSPIREIISCSVN